MKTSGGVLAALAVSILAGCSHPTKLRIYNETGGPIVVHVVRHPSTQHGVKRPEDLMVADGRRAEVFAYEFERGEISAAGCVYDYSAIPRSSVMAKTMHVAVQIEPDFSAHLLNLKAGRDRIGQFMDGAAPDFPIRPAKQCAARGG